MNGVIKFYHVINGIIRLIRELDYTSIIPDYNGNLWYTTRNGIIGVNGQYIILKNERIEKSFSINKENIVFVVTSIALYAITYNGNSIIILWMIQISFDDDDDKEAIFKGLGTTPLLLGEKVVAIADNAKPTYNVIFIDQKRGEII